MMVISRLLRVEHPDADVRRRGRNLILIALGLGACSIILAVVWLLQPDYLATGAAVGVLLSAAVALALSRQGLVAAAALLLVLLLLTIIFGQIIGAGSYANGSFYLLVPLLVAANTLAPRLFALVLFVCLGALGASVFAMPSAALGSSVERYALEDSAIMLAFAGLVGMVSAFNLHRSAREAARITAANEAAAAQLAQANASLERRVAERTGELEATLERERAQALTLQASLERQRDLASLVSALSQPILTVRPDVLVVPLVGAIDAERTGRLLGHILEKIEERRARAIILDVTGVALIDTDLARVLLEIAAAARLLGARTTLVGIRPEVAQTLVGLGADLGELHTAATLYEGLLAMPAHI